MRPARLAMTGSLGASAAWALWPLRTSDLVPALAGETPQTAPETAVAELDTSAFRAPLWISAPPPPPPAAAPAAPPPLKLQLLAVVREGGQYRAMLYDPDSDRILVAAEGERLGARTLERVTAAGVQIRDASGVRTLALRQGQPGGSP